AGAGSRPALRQARERGDVALEDGEGALERLRGREVDARRAQRVDRREGAAGPEEPQVPLGGARLALVDVLGQSGGGRDPGRVLERIERYVQVSELGPGDPHALVGLDVIAVALLEQVAHEGDQLLGGEALPTGDGLVDGQLE